MAKHSFIKFVLSIVLISTLTILQAQTLLTASLNTPGGAGILSEGCGGPYELVITRGPDNNETTEIVISDFGMALSGSDYNFPPGSFPVTMLPEDSIVVIPITVVNDGSAEGFETLFWEIAFLAGVESGATTIETGIVDEYSVEILSAVDTIVWCRDIPYVLQASSESEIHWSPASVFDDSLGTAATLRPHDLGWVYASVGTEECGAKDSVYFNLAIVDIEEPDTVYICAEGSGVILHGSLDGLATDFTWIPSDSTLSNPDILNPNANPTVTTTYILQSDIEVCTASARVVVRVDSIPEDLHIDIAPFKPYYCAGEVVALFSPSYDTLDFPDLTFNWTPFNATFNSAANLLNAALTLEDTTRYIRENINNACRSSDSILIYVVPSVVPLSVNDTSLCPGQMFTVLVLQDGIEDPEWTPEEGLSCHLCLDPKVTIIGPPGGNQVYQFAGKILDCPVGATLSITIPDKQDLSIAGDRVVCNGDQVQLTITNTDGLSNYHWEVQLGSASFSCTNCPNPIVTVTGSDVINILVTADTDNKMFCGAEGFIQLSPGQQLQVTGPALEACLGGTVVASTGDLTLTDVQWDVISGNLGLSCSVCENPTVTVNSAGLLRFFAESSNPDICRVIGSVDVSIFEGDVSNLLITPDPATGIGQGADVMASLNASPTPSSVTWTVNGVSIPSTITTITFNASEELNFVTAHFINSKGCEQTDTISFPTVPPEYKIPNAFTPDNGDEVNDNFKIIINGNINVDEFLIFNRWGQLVYEAPAGDLEGWDGQFKGEPAASDTYVYSAKLRFPNGDTRIAKGDVMLLR